MAGMQRPDPVQRSSLSPRCRFNSLALASITLIIGAGPLRLAQAGQQLGPAS